MKLSILMPALRRRRWNDIASRINAQIDALLLGDHVEFLMELDDGQATSGHKRNRLMQRARGQYLCFVDDDDAVAANYLSEIMDALKSSPDLVTFAVEFVYVGNRHRCEQWKLGLHPQNRKLGLMSANHLCVWKSAIAKEVAWPEKLGYYDDHCWFEPLLAAGLIQRHAHIDQMLYHYRFNPQVTVNQQLDRIARTREYLGQGLRCFKDRDDDIFIEVRPHESGETQIWVRDKLSAWSRKDIRHLTHFHTLRLPENQR